MVCLPDKGLLCFVAIGLTSRASLCEFKPCYHIYWFSDFVFLFCSQVAWITCLCQHGGGSTCEITAETVGLSQVWLFKTFFIVSTYDFEYACFDTM